MRSLIIVCLFGLVCCASGQRVPRKVDVESLNALSAILDQSTTDASYETTARKISSWNRLAMNPKLSQGQIPKALEMLDILVTVVEQESCEAHAFEMLVEASNSAGYLAAGRKPSSRVELLIDEAAHRMARSCIRPDGSAAGLFQAGALDSSNVKTYLNSLL